MAFSFSSEITKAIRRDDAAEVVRLMDSVKRTRSHELRAIRYLLESIERDKPAIVQALLDWGADPNGHQSQSPRTPLAQAAHFDRLECARILIGVGAELERLNKFSGTALQETKNAGMVALLLDAGAHIEAKSSPSPSPLFWACLRREEEAAQTLIERGAEIEPLNCSPLCRAVESGQVGIVRLLLQRGARVRREVVEPTPYLFDALEQARRGNPVNPIPINDEIVALLEEAQQRQSA